MDKTYQVIHTKVFPFSDEGGNPAPIVINAKDLTQEEMQLISKHYNLETGFVTSLNGQNISLRYFVPNYEMEMCVHASIGSIYVLLQEKLVISKEFTIKTSIGSIKGEIHQGKDGIIVFIEQFKPQFFPVNPTSMEICQALGIKESDLNFDLGPIQSVSCSRAKLIIPLVNYKVLANLKPNFEYLWELCTKYKTTGFYPFTIKTRDKRLDVEARQFPNNAGFLEDPATGVAASALASYLTYYNILPDLNSDYSFQYKIGQGFEMKHPSIIYTQNKLENNEVSRPLIGGTTKIDKKEVIKIDGNTVNKKVV